jgi:hypothetical protein
MHDAVHPSRMMIIRIVLYKARFAVYITNAGDITIRIVLNRRDVSVQDRRIHASHVQLLSRENDTVLFVEGLATVCPCIVLRESWWA